MNDLNNCNYRCNQTKISILGEFLNIVILRQFLSLNHSLSLFSKAVWCRCSTELSILFLSHIVRSGEGLFMQSSPFNRVKIGSCLSVILHTAAVQGKEWTAVFLICSKNNVGIDY